MQENSRIKAYEICSTHLWPLCLRINQFVMNDGYQSSLTISDQRLKTWIKSFIPSLEIHLHWRMTFQDATKSVHRMTDFSPTRSTELWSDSFAPTTGFSSEIPSSDATDSSGTARRRRASYRRQQRRRRPRGRNRSLPMTWLRVVHLGPVSKLDSLLCVWLSSQCPLQGTWHSNLICCWRWLDPIRFRLEWRPFSRHGRL